MLALNAGAKAGGFAHDTGEGSISRYHREHGGDLIWEIGSGYFGCRDGQGRFDPEKFAAQAQDPQVKSQFERLGIEPVHSSPEAFTQFSATETTRWKSVANKAGVKPE